MSNGKIIRPKNTNLLNNQKKSSEIDLIYSILESCEVHVNDNNLKDNYQRLSQKIENAKTKFVELEKKINNKQVELERKVGAKQVELMMVSKLKESFENQAKLLTELDSKLNSTDSKLLALNKFEKKINEIENSDQQNKNTISDLGDEIAKLKKIKSVELKITINSNPLVTLINQHKSFEKLLKIVSCKLNAYIVGPAGSGKTTAAENCAKALGINFYFTGAIASEYKLTGFMNAQGKIVSTDFRKAYEEGGLFLFDEIDASYPQAVLAFNAALANDFMDFPDGRINRHPDFYCIAAANTFGQGADREYVGRNQLDAASLDRFVFIEWDYDEELEMGFSGDEEWVKHVQKIRRVVNNLKIRHVISPRASMFGARLIKNGIPKEEVEKLVIWKGIDSATKNKIISNLR